MGNRGNDRVGKRVFSGLVNPVWDFLLLGLSFGLRPLLIPQGAGAEYADGEMFTSAGWSAAILSLLVPGWMEAGLWKKFGRYQKHFMVIQAIYQFAEPAYCLFAPGVVMRESLW